MQGLLSGMRGAERRGGGAAVDGSTACRGVRVPFVPRSHCRCCRFGVWPPRMCERRNVYGCVQCRTLQRRDAPPSVAWGAEQPLADGEQFHPEHFVCEVCRCTLECSYFMLNNRVVCERCCATCDCPGCGSPITTEFIAIESEKVRSCLKLLQFEFQSRAVASKVLQMLSMQSPPCQRDVCPRRWPVLLRAVRGQAVNNIGNEFFCT